MLPYLGCGLGRGYRDGMEEYITREKMFRKSKRPWAEGMNMCSFSKYQLNPCCRSSTVLGP